MLIAAVSIVAAGSMAQAATAGGAPSSTSPPAGKYADLVHNVDIVANGHAITSFGTDCRVKGQVFGMVEADHMRTPLRGSTFKVDKVMTMYAPFGQHRVHLRLNARMTSGGWRGTITTPSDSPMRCDPVHFTAAGMP